MLRRVFSGVLAASALAILAGCASQKMYAAQAPVNLVLKTTIDPGSTWTGSAVALDIHAAASACNLQYEGRVWLDAPEVRLGLAPGQPYMLSFAFASKNYLSGGGGAIRQETMFVARPGAAYVAEVSYMRGLYGVVLKETLAGGARVLEQRRPAC